MHRWVRQRNVYLPFYIAHQRVFQCTLDAQVSRAMKETLKKQLVVVHQQNVSSGTKKEAWIRDNCFQLVITSSQISW